MNLNDFDITTHSGLYISKDEHPIFGKKYIARFQYDKKRYVKVLGYEKRDKITLTTAINLRRIYNSLYDFGTDVATLSQLGFSYREIELLTTLSKSKVARTIKEKAKE